MNKAHPWLLSLALVLGMGAPGAQGLNSAQIPDTTARAWLAGLGALAGQWQGIESVRWFGQNLWLRQFVMDISLDEAAQAFTQTLPVLNRALSGADTLLLSGVQGTLHLVVQVQRSERGVEGFASAWDVSAQAAGRDGSDPALAWIPSDAQIHASSWQEPDGSRVHQSIYALPQAPAQLRARLGAELLRQGWRTDAAFTTAASAQWQRGADRVTLAADARGHGSLIYQLWITRGTP